MTPNKFMGVHGTASSWGSTSLGSTIGPTMSSKRPILSGQASEGVDSGEAASKVSSAAGAQHSRK
eukprot:5587994-Alexandrium_andersonii.AAC.1